MIFFNELIFFSRKIGLKFQVALYIHVIYEYQMG